MPIPTPRKLMQMHYSHMCTVPANLGLDELAMRVHVMAVGSRLYTLDKEA